MKVLITGGAGSVGVYLTASLLSLGHEARVLDKNLGPLQTLKNRKLTLVQGSVEDRDTVQSCIQGVDAVIHLAWSFSEDPLEVLEQDLRGHIYLLEEAVSQKVRHFIYTSTAVVYGKPQYSPIDERHPLVVEEARKPLYGIAKAAAEKLCLMYWKGKELPATIFRFWWAYGEEIGGRHLREMLKTAAKGESLEVPGDSGGSFLYMEDLAQALHLTLFNPRTYGETFNFSTVYVTWEEVAEMVREATGSHSEVMVIPREEWQGSAFLADPWKLDDSRAREILEYKPIEEAPKAKESLKKAIYRCWEVMGKAVERA